MGKNSLPTTGDIAYKPSKSDIQREKDYQAREDIDILKRSEEIKRDKARMKNCKEYAASQIKALKKV